VNLYNEGIQKKRAGDLPGALSLFMKGIEAEEKENNGYAASPDLYEEVAKIYRKKKDRDNEIEILERFAKRRRPPGKRAERLYQRLIRVYELNKQIEIREKDGESFSFHIGYGTPIEECPPFIALASIIDVETTGLSNNDDIIEIGILTFKYSKLTGNFINKISEYHSLNEPHCAIDVEAQRIHGISYEDTEGHRMDLEAIQKIIEKSDILIAHNASFDRKYLAKYLPEVQYAVWHCTVYGIKWKNYGFKSKKLKDLVKTLKISLVGPSHRSLSDAYAVLTILQLKNNAGEPYLYELINSPPLSTAKSSDEHNKRGRNLTITYKLDESGKITTVESWDDPSPSESNEDISAIIEAKSIKIKKETPEPITITAVIETIGALFLIIGLLVWLT